MEPHDSGGPSATDDIGSWIDALSGGLTVQETGARYVQLLRNIVGTVQYAVFWSLPPIGDETKPLVVYPTNVGAPRIDAAAPTAQDIQELVVAHPELPFIAIEGASLPIPESRPSAPVKQAPIVQPIRSRGVPVAAVVFVSERALTPADQAYLRLLAAVAAPHVHVAELVDEAERAKAVVQELERLNKAKSDFVSIVSHEFRTPLTGIQGFSEMMVEEDLTYEEMKEFASDINKDAKRLNRLISEMLDLDRMESGRMTLNVEPVDLNALIRSVVGLVKPNAPAHYIVVDLADDIPELQADHDKLTQVVTNLLNNAVKYSPNGGNVVVCSRVVDDTVQVSVRDHGAGIPPDALETVFERYTRVESTARYVQGTGLGLPIVRQIVQMHGGRVWVESELGKGSTFTVALPMVVASLEAPE